MGNVANIFAFFCKTTERGNGEPYNNKKKERERESTKQGVGIIVFCTRELADENSWQGSTEARYYPALSSTDVVRET